MNENFTPNEDIKQNDISVLKSPAPKRRVWPKIFWTVVVISLIFLSFFFIKAYTFGSRVFVSHSSIIKKISSSFSGQKLQGESEGQINVLILGYGGEGHDGPYLTDSIIVASIRPQDNTLTLRSIPRDYLWKTPKGGSEKINVAYTDGYLKNHDHDAAGEQARLAAEDVSGLDIPYFASIDFKGFEEAVDRVGGLDVTVENTFTDYEFPNDATNGYLPPLTFKAGFEHMNGVRALEFARSRHAAGPEGSDFARSKRQAKILQAFKSKIKEQKILSDTSALNDLLGILSNHFHTNMEPGQVIHLYKLLHDDSLTIKSASLDESTGLVCPKFINEDTDQRMFVETTCDGITKADIHGFFQKDPDLNSTKNSSSSDTPSKTLKSEAATIILENADPSHKTTYNSMKSSLQAAGAVIYEVPYKGLPISKSVLYEVNPKPETEKFIEGKLNIKHQEKPESMIAKSDLVLIITEGTK